MAERSLRLAPKVSVVIPVHNRQKLVAACVESVRAQEVDTPVEILVVDDNSTDHSVDVAESAGAAVIRLDRNGGPGVARNSGIAAATGEWIAFLDSDDRWAPEHLHTLLAASGDLVMVASSGITANEGRLRVIGGPFVRRRPLSVPSDLLRPENVINTSACMVRAATLRAAGGFPVSRFSEDLELWLRVITLGKGSILPDLTVYCHTHAGQTSRANAEAMSGSVWTAIAASEALGALPALTRRRLEVVAAWDQARRGDGRVRTVLRSPHSAAALALLLAHRAAMRHRWRLQPGRTRHLVELGPSGS